MIVMELEQRKIKIAIRLKMAHGENHVRFVVTLFLLRTRTANNSHLFATKEGSGISPVILYRSVLKTTLTKEAGDTMVCSA